MPQAKAFPETVVDGKLSHTLYCLSRFYLCRSAFVAVISWNSNDTLPLIIAVNVIESILTQTRSALIVECAKLCHLFVMRGFACAISRKIAGLFLIRDIFIPKALIAASVHGMNPLLMSLARWLPLKKLHQLNVSVSVCERQARLENRKKKLRRVSHGSVSDE